MTFQKYVDLYGAKLVQAIGIHIGYVVVSVAIGFVVALILGIVLSRAPKISAYVLPVLSVFQTIPGIVFLGILYLYLGMVPATAITALSVYAVFPILKNTYVGLVEVPEQYLEAGRGCGMSPAQLLWHVELPLALPAIMGGVRMSVIYTVSWASLTTMIGLGGLGEFIYTGVSTNNNVQILIGAIPSALLAISMGLLIDALKKIVIPRGLREGGKK